MKTRKIGRQCMVPGCRNHNSYMIHRTREPWPSVIICEKCIEDAFYVLCPEQIQEAEQEDAEGVVKDAQESEGIDAEAEQEEKNAEEGAKGGARIKEISENKPKKPSAKKADGK